MNIRHHSSFHLTFLKRSRTREKHFGAKWRVSFLIKLRSKVVILTCFTLFSTGLIEGCNRRKCIYCLFIEVEYILVRFPTFVIGSNLAEIVKIENTRLSNENDVDRGYGCDVRRASKTPHLD